MSTTYKKISVSEVQNRAITVSNTSDKTSMENIVNNFINYFKSKHLS